MKKLIIFLVCIFLLFFQTSYAAEKIAYSNLTGDYWQIWVLDVEQGEHQQVTNSFFDKRSPTFSPDGSKLLFRTANGELFILDLETKKEEQILSDIKYLVDPQWINGEEVLLTRYRTDVKDDSDIWLVNIETLEKKVLVSRQKLQYQPTMSKDGKKLIYVSSIDPLSHQLYLKDMGGNKAKLLTPEQGLSIMPCFSPDGKKVAFVSNKTSDNEIYLLDLEKNSVKQITKREGIDTHPVFLNDKEIIYTSYMDGLFQINKINVETLETKTLIRKETDCVEPDWTK